MTDEKPNTDATEMSGTRAVAARAAEPPSPFDDDPDWLYDAEDEAPLASAVPTVSRANLQQRDNFASAGEFVLHHGRDVDVRGRTFLIHGKDNEPRVKLQLARQKRTGKVIPAWEVEPARINLEGPEVEALYAHLTAARENLGVKEQTAYLLVRLGADPNITGLEALLKMVAENPGSLAGLTDTVGADQLGALRALVNIGRFRLAKQELERLIAENPIEGVFQRWFEENDWVFGTEYVERWTKGNRRITADSSIDLMFIAVDGFADIFELKRPGPTVFIQPADRNFLVPSSDLNAAFGQAVHYLAEADNYVSNNLMRGVPLYRPRVRLVIGRSNGWTEEHWKAYRDTTAAWHRIELLTYDMVLRRIDLLIATMTRELRTKTVPEPVADVIDVFG